MSGGSLEVLRSNFCRKYVRGFYYFLKCLGGSRMVLGVPRTPLQIIYCSGNVMFLTCFFYCLLYCLLNCLLYCLLYCLVIPGESLGPIHCGGMPIVAYWPANRVIPPLCHSADLTQRLKQPVSKRSATPREAQVQEKHKPKRSTRPSTRGNTIIKENS